jgi:hypothetical protein
MHGLCGDHPLACRGAHCRVIYLQSTGVLLKGGSHVCRWDLGTAAVPLWCQYARCTSQLIAQLPCRLKHRTFSSNDLRDCDFSERKDDALKLHRTIEVEFVHGANCALCLNTMAAEAKHQL